jgi:hypothetical protein
MDRTIYFLVVFGFAVLAWRSERLRRRVEALEQGGAAAAQSRGA